MNGDERGFNPSEIENLTTYVGTTASRVAAEIENIINTRIMQPVSTGWAAPEAVEYFEGGFKPTVLASGQAITETYNNFIKALQESVNIWAENTKAVAPQLQPITDVTIEINSGLIHDEMNGNIVISRDICQSVINDLPSVEADIQAKMRELNTELDASTSYIGGNQAQAIQECFASLSEIVRDVFKYINEDDENSLQANLLRAVEKYEQIAEQIQSGFANSGTASAE